MASTPTYTPGKPMINFGGAKNRMVHNKPAAIATGGSNPLGSLRKPGASLAPMKPVAPAAGVPRPRPMPSAPVSAATKPATLPKPGYEWHPLNGQWVQALQTQPAAPTPTAAPAAVSAAPQGRMATDGNKVLAPVASSSPANVATPAPTAPTPPKHYANLVDWLTSHPYAAHMNHVAQTEEYKKSLVQSASTYTAQLNTFNAYTSAHPSVAINPVTGGINPSTAITGTPPTGTTPPPAPVHYANLSDWLTSHPYAAHMNHVDQTKAYHDSLTKIAADYAAALAKYNKGGGTIPTTPPPTTTPPPSIDYSADPGYQTWLQGATNAYNARMRDYTNTYGMNDAQYQVGAVQNQDSYNRNLYDVNASLAARGIYNSGAQAQAQDARNQTQAANSLALETQYGSYAQDAINNQRFDTTAAYNNDVAAQQLVAKNNYAQNNPTVYQY